MSYTLADWIEQYGKVLVAITVDNTEVTIAVPFGLVTGGRYPYEWEQRTSPETAWYQMQKEGLLEVVEVKKRQE